VNLLLQKRSSVARSLPLAGILFLSPLLAAAQAPDVIFFHGNILTGTRLKAGDSDPVPARVAALAVRNGSIVAVGSDKDMLALKGPHTSTIDLNGAFAMPGFNDAHTHMASAGQQRLSVDLDGTKSLAEMLSRIQAYSTTQAPGQWVLGGGWDHTKWTGAKLPTKSDLDAVTGDHPAFLERTDGHIAIINTAALKVAGITDSTPDPRGGKIDRDVDGHATGIIREGPALALIQQRIPPPSYELRRKALELSIKDALTHGVTSVQDFSDWDDWLVLEELEHAGKLNLRVAEWIDFNLTVGDLEQRRSSHPVNDPLLHLTMLKGFMDGSLGSRTAAMNDPYSDDPSNSGIPRYGQQKLNQMASARAAAGFQLGFHAIGDLANDMALNALATAEQVGRPADAPPPPSNPSEAIVDTVLSPPTPASFRFRIEHAQVLSPGAFDRFAQLGIIASMQPSHLLTDMAWAPARLGPERSKRAYAWKSFLDHGVTLAFGTDYPVESISPFRGLYSAVTRQNEAGTQTFEPQEKLTIQEAIYAYTQASAFAEFREHVKGRLEPGYLADLVVLDRDITKATPQDLLHAKVLRTVVGGQTRYSSQGVNKQ
jgi:predicted amidohydrolase YtcJ